MDNNFCIPHKNTIFLKRNDVTNVTLLKNKPLTVRSPYGLPD